MFNLRSQCSTPKLWDPTATIRRYHVWCLPTLLIFHKFPVPSNIFSYIHSTYKPIKIVVNQQFKQPLSSFIHLRPSNSQSSPMFSTIAIFIATIFAASAVASPGIKNSCNTGPIQFLCGLWLHWKRSIWPLRSATTIVFHKLQGRTFIQPINLRLQQIGYHTPGVRGSIVIYHPLDLLQSTWRNPRSWRGSAVTLVSSSFLPYSLHSSSSQRFQQSQI